MLRRTHHRSGAIRDTDEHKSTVNSGDMQLMIDPNPTRDHITGQSKTETKARITDVHGRYRRHGRHLASSSIPMTDSGDLPNRLTPILSLASPHALS